MNSGYLGAYGFRLLALVFAASIIDNPMVKFFGSLYLVWLMCNHFAGQDNEQQKVEPGDAAAAHRAFASTVMMIALMDLSLSVDNVVAAIALSPYNLWPVYLGVTIGIICLRLVAGVAARMIEKYPVLEHTAFLLVGYVGGMLMAELTFHWHIDRLVKFAGIVAIIALSLAYASQPVVSGLLSPLIRCTKPIMRAISRVADTLFGLVALPFRVVFRKTTKP